VKNSQTNCSKDLLDSNGLDMVEGVDCFVVFYSTTTILLQTLVLLREILSNTILAAGLKALFIESFRSPEKALCSVFVTD